MSEGFTTIMRWLVLGVVLFEAVLCQEVPCPFHPCTPEQLGCPSSRLLKNKRGCLLCRCEETILQEHPCSLHGCTVKLLNCNGTTLRKDENGCDLCECSNPAEENVTLSTMPRNPMMEILDPGQGQGDDLFEPTCPPLDPPCTLECERRAVNPRTQCEECRCEDIPDGGIALTVSILDGVREDQGANQTELEIQNPCPDPMEMVEDDSMQLGRNGRKRPKYKLQLKKLKKGFKPRKTYKILIRGSNRSPFKAFLLDLKPAPEASAAASARSKGRRRPTAASAASGDTAEAENCGVGTFNGSNVVRVSLDCPTAAIEGDTSNKTKSAITWTAPDCGCVHIRAAVVDYTDRVVYMDDATAPSGGRRRAAQPGKVNKPLWKTVCSKKNSRRRPRPTTKPPTQKGLKAGSECCRAAILYGSMSKHSRNRGATEGCEQQATLFTMGRYRYNRYKGLQRTCMLSYKKCCESIILINEQPDVGKHPRKSQRRIPQSVLSVIMDMLGSVHNPPRMRPPSRRPRKPGRNHRKKGARLDSRSST